MRNGTLEAEKQLGRISKGAPGLALGSKVERRGRKTESFSVPRGNGGRGIILEVESVRSIHFGIHNMNNYEKI